MENIFKSNKSTNQETLIFKEKFKKFQKISALIIIPLNILHFFVVDRIFNIGTTEELNQALSTITISFITVVFVLSLIAGLYKVLKPIGISLG